MDTFIVKDGASNFYLSTESAGSFLTPPGHATQKFSIIEKRGGHVCGFYSLESDFYQGAPTAVIQRAKTLLKKYPGNIKDETWIKAVYTHMRHCYRTPDGQDPTFGKFWGNSEKEVDLPAEWHRAVIYIRKYDPAHQPRTELF